MSVLSRQPSSFDAGEMEDDENLDNVSDVYDSDEEDSEEEEEDDVKLAEPSKTAINNKEGLLDKLSEINWPKNVDWIHSLVVVIDQEKEVDVNDDLAREAAFYTQALQGTRECFAKLESMHKPYLRPSDYYAEMVKSDSHMEKVRKKLLAEKKHLEEQEQRRNMREQRGIAKQVQAETQKKRAQDKKQQIDSVKKWRKQRERSGFSDNKDEMALPFEDGASAKGKGRRPPVVSPGDRSGGKEKRYDGKGKKRSGRDSRDSKFGFGGRKGMKKQNTADTTSDLRGFNRNSESGGRRRKTK